MPEHSVDKENIQMKTKQVAWEPYHQNIRSDDAELSEQSADDGVSEQSADDGAWE